MSLGSGNLARGVCVRALWLTTSAVLLFAALAAAGGTKSLSGKLRRVEGDVLTIEKKGLLSSSLVSVILEKDTKVTGQLAPGMHVQVKYREEKDPDAPGKLRKVAVQIEARPEYATKDAREAAKVPKP